MSEERVQRRLAAILAADVVGYSRLVRADEEGTLAALKGIRKDIIDPKIAEHHGRIVKLMGDGMLAEFGSAVDAVRNAVEVQQAVTEQQADVPDDRRIQFRVGVNLGDVVIDGDDIHGDGVNVAARLEGLADPGSVCISEAVHDQVRDRIDVPFEDLGEQKVKNIDRPVRVWQWVTDESTMAGTSGRAEKPQPLSNKPSVAVLPFDNLSGDPEQQYFADGIAEEVITALAAWHYFPVIARGVTFSYAGTDLGPKQIAQELGVDYLVTGSVRRSEERLRVSIQLIDSTTGHQVWSEKYDRTFEHMFEIQDDIAQKVAATIEPELEWIEGRKALTKNPKNLAAWDCCQRGTALLHEFSKSGNRTAREMFLRAIAIDPTYSKALTGLAYSYHRDLFWDYPEDRVQWQAEFLSAAQRAVYADQTDSSARVVLAYANIWEANYELAIAEAEQAVALNPGNAFAHIALGETLDMVGRRKEALRSAQTGIDLNSRDPRIHTFLGVMARICLAAGDYLLAETWARRTLHKRVDYPHAHVYLAAALSLQGKPEEAQSVLQNCDRHPVGLALCYQDPADNNRILEGLRMAGWQGAVI